MSKTELTDRELLALAAKAVGLGIDGHNENKTAWVYRLDDIPDENGECDTFVWRPLTDDGDALRLAADLGLAVVPYPIYARPKHSVIAKRYEESQAVYRGEVKQVEVIEVYGEDAARSTRRAIVRAAAEIGREADIAENADYLAG